MANRFPQIQGIRAFAIIGVFFVHTAIWLADDLGNFSMLIARYGGSAVIMFFMLSGFLLSYRNSIVPTLKGTALLKSAWAKVSKTYGLFLVTLLVVFISNFPSSPKEWIQAFICMPFQLTLTQAFVPVRWITHAFNGPAWFLSALFGIWILVYVCHKSVNKMMTFSAGKCIGAILAILVVQTGWLLFEDNFILPVLKKHHYFMWCHDWLTYSSPLLCFSEYCVGVLMGRMCVQRQYSVFAQNILALIAILMVSVAAFIIASPLKVIIPWIVIAECISCVVLFAVISPKSIGYRVLSGSPLVWFGNISGYFYLIHGAVNYAMCATIADYIPKPWLFFMSFAISTLLAAFADNYYNAKRIQVRKENT